MSSACSWSAALQSSGGGGRTWLRPGVGSGLDETSKWKLNPHKTEVLAVRPYSVVRRGCSLRLDGFVLPQKDLVSHFGAVLQRKAGIEIRQTYNSDRAFIQGRQIRQ